MAHVDRCQRFAPGFIDPMRPVERILHCMEASRAAAIAMLVRLPAIRSDGLGVMGGRILRRPCSASCA